MPRGQDFKLEIRAWLEFKNKDHSLLCLGFKVFNTQYQMFARVAPNPWFEALEYQDTTFEFQAFEQPEVALCWDLIAQFALTFVIQKTCLAAVVVHAQTEIEQNAGVDLVNSNPTPGTMNLEHLAPGHTAI
jgi:hypothetical protein